MIESFSKNGSKISYFPVFPTLAKFGVFPRTVITGNYHWEFPPPVFPGQPWVKGIDNAIDHMELCFVLSAEE